MTVEVWRPVVGYETQYDVSNLGRVRVAGTREEKTQRRTRAYLDVTLYERNPNGRGKHRSIKTHVLVAAAFIGPRPVGSQIRHLDGEGTNNTASNLVYGTRSENMMDRHDHGTVRNANTNKTHCVRNHEFTPENTYLTTGGTKRQCRRCMRLRSRGLADGTWETVYNKNKS